MVVSIRPEQGGFLRPFGCAWFIIEFLKGNGPEESRRIDPSIGAPMTDIHFEYKSALHRAHARDTVKREEEGANQERKIGLYRGGVQRALSVLLQLYSI